MNYENLKLDKKDPKVVKAYAVEKELFDFYGIINKDHFVTLPTLNLKVRISEFGEGKPIVIVPGNTGDVFVQTSLIAALKGRKIFAINRPGGGLSEGMDHNLVDIRQFAFESLDYILNALNLTNVDVVAHSMGAHWSTLLAMEKSGRVKRLVLLGNPGNIMGGKPPLPIRLLAIPIFSNIVMKLMLPQKPKSTLRVLTIMGHSKEFVNTLPNQLRNAYFAFDHLPHYKISFASLLQNMIPPIVETELKKLHQPTALILGTNDNFLSQENGRKIVAVIPNGTFYSIENSGHLPWLENLQKVADIILNFLA
ncbi:alpha/beta fold hydrolase [Rhizosphaericola mali]|uniref:Alpha/beta hydrolase n=1 Tax=Rhizosphaericola mali TaxID=2545455 RepID=A0A5P2FY29_9BACT|nr:alpha/beta hydrolase [Rhizosphaericola mali]QES88095.1 alpha/beta hydrolase [Rhizosphaericola mali]